MEPQKYNKVYVARHKKGDEIKWDVELRHGRKKIHTSCFATEIEARSFADVRKKDVEKAGGAAVWTEFDPEGGADMAVDVLREANLVVLSMASMASTAQDAAVLRAKTNALKAVRDATQLIVSADQARNRGTEDLARLDWPALLDRARQVVKEVKGFISEFANS